MVACDSALGGLSFLYLVFAYVVVEYRLPYVPICPFFLVTGTPCPLCGSTRMIGGYLHEVIEVGWSQLPSLVWLAFVASVGLLSVVHVIRSLSRLRSPRKWAMSNNNMQRTAPRAAADGTAVRHNK